ncbi:calmodulin [Mycena maculata]|uniref:Calmodulin n=1 Tax=Mycena maculata TaxID=230809 RepID=A0AAD7N2X9_9AGAR|nr:calmodulin [Mycena maculata]
MRSLGHNPTETLPQHMISEMELEGEGGEIEFNEFIAMIAANFEPEDEQNQQWVGLCPRRPAEAGKISSADLKQIMRNLGQNMTERQVNEIIRKADIHVDADGQISNEDFIKFPFALGRKLPGNG